MAEVSASRIRRRDQARRRRWQGRPWLSGDRVVTCRMCDVELMTLGRHLVAVHATTSKAYRDRYGKEAPLVADNVRGAARDRALDRGIVPYWTAERIAGALRAFYERNGRAAARRDLSHGRIQPAFPARRRRTPAMATILRFFPNLSAANRAAGVTPIRPGGQPTVRWNEQRILSAIRRWARHHGRPPTASDWQLAATDHPSAFPVRQRFGNFDRAVMAAGLTPIKRYAKALHRRGSTWGGADHRARLSAAASRRWADGGKAAWGIAPSNVGGATDD